MPHVLCFLIRIIMHTAMHVLWKPDRYTGNIDVLVILPLSPHPTETFAYSSLPSFVSLELNPYGSHQQSSFGVQFQQSLANGRNQQDIRSGKKRKVAPFISHFLPDSQ